LDLVPKTAEDINQISAKIDFEKAENFCMLTGLNLRLLISSIPTEHLVECEEIGLYSKQQSLYSLTRGRFTHDIIQPCL